MPFAAVSATTAVLLAATIGVLGALLGATASGIATYKIEGRRQEFERRQRLRRERREKEVELAVMRGAARVWFNELESYMAMLGLIKRASSPRWWPDDLHDPMVPAISIEDRKLIATLVTEDGWDKIRQAEDAIHVVEVSRSVERRQAELSANEPGPPLNQEHDKKAVENAIERSLEAVVVLQAAARAQPVVTPDA
jgi:hypothetical protein